MAEQRWRDTIWYDLFKSLICDIGVTLIPPYFVQVAGLFQPDSIIWTSIGIIFVIILIVLTYIFRRRRLVRLSNQDALDIQPGTTNFVPEVVWIPYMPFRQYGVDWKVCLGFKERWEEAQFLFENGQEPFVYVNGPYCPDDNRKLMLHNKPGIIGGKIKYWKCPNPACSKLYKRPKDVFDKEADYVRQNMAGHPKTLEIIEAYLRERRGAQRM